MTTLAPIITPALGEPAEQRFVRDMDRLGYDVCRYDQYSHVEMCCEPALRARLTGGLREDYRPTALYWRTAPDFFVRPRSFRAWPWLAEVKAPSERWGSLAIEACQLMQLYLLEQTLRLDIRYVQVAEMLRWRAVGEVFADVRVVYVNATHPSYEGYVRLRGQCDVRWKEQTNRLFYDPYVLVPPTALAHWLVVPPAREAPNPQAPATRARQLSLPWSPREESAL